MCLLASSAACGFWLVHLRLTMARAALAFCTHTAGGDAVGVGQAEHAHQD